MSAEPDHQGPMDENGDPVIPVENAMTDKTHSVNESADKIQLETKLKRGTDTRDQDTIKVKVKGDDPEEVVNKLNESLALLTETADNVRAIQPE